jgi:hypothetical protein
MLALLAVVVLAGGNPLRLFARHELSTLKANLYKEASTEFTEVNDHIRKEYGFVYKIAKPEAVSCYDSHDALGNKNPDSCSISNQAEPVTADDAFIRHWRTTSPALEQWLLQHGWQKTWNAKQPIAEILDRPQNDGSIGVNYIKSQGEVTCTLSFMWVQPYVPNQLNSTEMCDGSLDRS